MATREELYGISGLMEGFQADRAIHATRIIQADMSIYGIDVDTDATLVAVNMIIRPTDPTDPAFLAVVLALVLIIQENAEGTPIGAHGCLTGFTYLLSVLNGFAR